MPTDLTSHVHELRLDGTGWAQANISAIVTNNPPAFPIENGGPIFAYATSGRLTRII
jgi:hypothetical protein